MSGTRLSGLRVLVVEDELLISMLIEDVLGDNECTVVGPFNSVTNALDAARCEPLDLAVLDVNVAGTMVYPVAEILDERHVPFLLLSGYGNAAIPQGKPRWHAFVKPFRTEELIAKLESLVESH
jgi:DNA-binding response OmpR family regulator